MPDVRELVSVFVAGGAGATARLWLSSIVDERGFRLPHAGTLVVNVIGCLAIGLLAAMVPRGPWRTIIGAGLLGGFTTYTAFALLTLESIGGQRWAVLALQWAGHLVGGVVAVALGFWLGSLVTPNVGRT